MPHVECRWCHHRIRWSRVRCSRCREYAAVKISALGGLVALAISGVAVVFWTAHLHP